MSEPTPAPASPARETGRARSWSNAFIVLVLAYQVGMPLTYYLGGRGYDELFSWRMFSTVRLQECDITVSETVSLAGGAVERATPLARDLQVAWVGVLRRLRSPVIAKYLARRCDEADARQATLVGRCVDTDGTSLPQRRFVMACDTRELLEASAP